MSQHRRLTPENKIRPPLLPRLEPTTFLTGVWRSTTQLSPFPYGVYWHRETKDYYNIDNTNRVLLQTMLALLPHALRGIVVDNTDRRSARTMQPEEPL